jgi:hypothetical protein
MTKKQELKAKIAATLLIGRDVTDLSINYALMAAEEVIRRSAPGFTADLTERAGKLKKVDSWTGRCYLEAPVTTEVING